MRATQLRLAWQWTFVFTDEPTMTPPRLTWHHTEFGRRSDCERYRIVHQGAGWSLLDADWNPIASAPSIPAAQQRAEQIAARAAAAAHTRKDPNR